MTLQILFLGPPEVRWGDKIISIQRRIPRALLFYLATQGGLKSREEVISIFWNDEPQANTKQRLSENLSRLRSVLPDPDIIITEKEVVGLDLKKVFIDFVAFEDLIYQAGRIPWQIPEDEPLPDSTYHILRKAINLWRGSKFLACDILPSSRETDEWVTHTTSHLEHLRGNILERMAGHNYAVGDLASAYKLANMALENDEFNENLHFRMMQYLIEDGRPNEATQHFERVQKLMQEEADISPSPKLISLHQRIHKPHPAEPALTPPKWEIHPGLTVRFVGRRDILLQIRKAFNQHSGVFILGEAGLGKTRLIQAFSSQVYPEPRLLVATCRPLETSLPFQPITEILRRHVTPDEWLALPDVWASYLTDLIPEIGTMRPELESPTIPEDPQQGQALIFEAIRRVFLLMSKETPSLFVLDDAHWADEATLSTIAYLIARPPFDNAASLAVLARPEEFSPHLEKCLQSVQQSKHGEIINLSRLNRKDIADLTRFILQKVPSPEFVTRLQIGTGGNALFVLETLRSILESDPSMDVSKNAKFSLSENLQNSIQHRLQKVSAFDRSILESAAVIGSEFDSKMLMEITYQSHEEIAHTLGQLEKDMLIERLPQNQRASHYRFIHDLFREALLLEISPVRSTYLHQQVAQVLRQNYQPEQAPVLAYHLEAAGEWESAFEFWVEAGVRARNLFSITDSNRSFRQAEDLLEHIEPMLSDEIIYRLYANWCEMAYEIQNTAQLQSLGENLLALGEKRNNPLLIGTALDSLSDACMTMNKFEMGLDLATQAISYLEQSENIFELMEAHIHRGVFLYMLNNLGDALESFEDALALGITSESLQVIGARSHAHYQISLLRTLGGWPEKGEHHAQLSLEDGKTSNRTYQQISAYFVLGLSNLYLCKFHQARKYSQIGIDLARRTQGWRMYGYIQSNAAESALAIGKPDLAMQHAYEAIYLGKRFELNDVLALGYRQVGEIYLNLNAPEEAITYFMHGVEAVGEHFTGVDNLFRLGMAQFRTGQRELGRQTMSFALAAFENNSVYLGITAAQIYLLTSYIESEEWGEARQLSDFLNGQSNWRVPIYNLMTTILLGKLALHEGQIEEAIDSLRLAIQKSKSIEHVWIELDAQATLRQALEAANIKDDQPTLRIREILAALKTQTKDAALVTAFEIFQRAFM